ncbi:MAG: DUF86 domain-containing protein [Cyanobacteria bacterium]|nr:DUF86 domain-containing protein [Cyanobacteriota bacterium]
MFTLEILGEATKKIPDEVRSQYSSVPWKAIAGMRDMLMHEYWGICKCGLGDSEGGYTPV